MILRISLALAQHTQSHLTLISRMLSLLPLPVAADLTWVSQQLFGLPLLVEWHLTSVSPPQTLLPLEVDASACSIPCLPTSLTRQDLYAPRLALPRNLLYCMHQNQKNKTNANRKYYCLDKVKKGTGSERDKHTSYHKRSLAKPSPTLFKSQMTILPSMPGEWFY